MQGRTVFYNGRPVSTAHFRVFIYGKEGKQKLVNSWDEFQTYISTGEWFTTAEDAKALEGEVVEFEVEALPELDEKPKKRRLVNAKRALMDEVDKANDALNDAAEADKTNMDAELVRDDDFLADIKGD